MWKTKPGSHTDFVLLFKPSDSSLPQSINVEKHLVFVSAVIGNKENMSYMYTLL